MGFRTVRHSASDLALDPGVISLIVLVLVSLLELVEYDEAVIGVGKRRGVKAKTMRGERKERAIL